MTASPLEGSGAEESRTRAADLRRDTVPAGLADHRAPESGPRTDAVLLAGRPFGGEKGQVKEVRSFVDAVLRARVTPDGDLLDEALLLVSEVATNAIRHTRSGEPGGTFDVEVYRWAGTVLIEVHDQGPPSHGPHRTPRVREVALDGEHGRGLAMVDALAAEWHARRSTGGLVVAFALRC